MRTRVLVVGAILGATLAVGLAVLLVGRLWQTSRVSYAATSAVTPSATTLVTGVAVQNLSSTQVATVVIEFYDQNGNRVDAATISTTVDPSVQRSFFTGSPGFPLPSGFIGSAVVSSDQPVAAIVNTQTPSDFGSEANPLRIGTSLGVDSPTAKVYAPQIMKNYYLWNSAIYAQNTSSSSAVITTTIIGTDGLVKDVQAVTVAPYAMKDFVQSTNAALSDGFVGSAVVESTAPIAVTVNFWNANRNYTEAQFQSYNGITGGGTKLYVPRLVRKYYDYNGGFKVQNLGTAETRVRVTYNIASSIGVTQEVTVQPRQAWGPYMGDDRQVPAGLASGTGSAIIESLDGQPIAAIVNEDNRLLGRGSTYTAILDGTQTDTLFLPQVTSRYYGYASGLQFMNVGSAAASGTITLTKAGKTINIPFSGIDTGRSFSFFAPNADDPNPDQGITGGKLWNFNGSATIKTSNGQPIVGIYNMSFRSDYDGRYGGKVGDSATTGNALNR